MNGSLTTQVRAVGCLDAREREDAGSIGRAYAVIGERLGRAVPGASWARRAAEASELWARFVGTPEGEENRGLGGVRLPAGAEGAVRAVTGHVHLGGLALFREVGPVLAAFAVGVAESADSALVASAVARGRNGEARTDPFLLRGALRCYFDARHSLYGAGAGLARLGDALLALHARRVVTAFARSSIEPRFAGSAARVDFASRLWRALRDEHLDALCAPVAASRERACNPLVRARLQTVLYHSCMGSLRPETDWAELARGAWEMLHRFGGPKEMSERSASAA